MSLNPPPRSPPFTSLNNCAFISVSGQVRGDEYMPYAFIQAQRNSAETFFRQNGFLDYDRAAKLRVRALGCASSAT